MSRIILTSLLIAFAAVIADAGERAIRVGCPNIPTASLDRSITFYTSVLSFKVRNAEEIPGIAKTAHAARTARLELGDECLDLTQYRPEGKPYFIDSQANDLWFQHVAIVVSNMAGAYERLRQARVQFVSAEPQTLPAWNTNASGISALYFRDPDGHYLELIHFPPGKGQAKWQIRSAKLFLGIDHTAIAVSDTQRSVRFYQDELKFRKTGSSENYGVEQEHLSGVFNAHVLITSLRSNSGIGIELLEYLTPATGRPIPDGLHPEDLACWLTLVEVAPGNSAANKWMKLPANADSWREASFIKDPDGHRLQLVRQ